MISSRLKGLLLSAGLLLCAISSARAISVVVSTGPVSREVGWTSVAIDSSSGSAYLSSMGSGGLSVGFGAATRIDLSNYSESSSILSAGPLASPVLLDPTSNYVLYVTSGIFPVYYKLGTASFSFLDVNFSSVGQAFQCGVVDGANGFAYYGTDASSATIVKVNTVGLVEVSSIPLSVGNLRAAYLDSANGFAYFVGGSTVGVVVKLRLSDFTVAGVLPLAAGEGGVLSMAVDTTRQVAYLGTNDSPGKIVEVNLSNMTRTGSATLATGENAPTAAVFDASSGMVFFGTSDTPAVIVGLFANSLTEIVKLTLGTGQGPAGGAIALGNGLALFTINANPAQLLKIDFLSGVPVIFSQPADANVAANQSATFSVGALGHSLTYQWARDGVDISGATAASYTLSPVTFADDGATFSCLVTNSSGTVRSRAAILTIVPVIRVYPNPWRIDRHSGLPLTFDQLPPNAIVKIFTLSAHWVKTVQSSAGTAAWDLTNDAGERVASGYYFYLMTTGKDAQTVHGKLAIIK